MAFKIRSEYAFMLSIITKCRTFSFYFHFDIEWKPKEARFGEWGDWGRELVWFFCSKRKTDLVHCTRKSHLEELANIIHTLWTQIAINLMHKIMWNPIICGHWEGYDVRNAANPLLSLLTHNLKRSVTFYRNPTLWLDHFGCNWGFISTSKSCGSWNIPYQALLILLFNFMAKNIRKSMLVSKLCLEEEIPGPLKCRNRALGITFGFLNSLLIAAEISHRTWSPNANASIRA
jgi:hypothetical protein